MGTMVRSGAGLALELSLDVNSSSKLTVHNGIQRCIAMSYVTHPADNYYDITIVYQDCMDMVHEADIL